MPPKHHRDARKTQRTLTFRVWVVDVVNGKNRCSSAGAGTNKRNSPHRTTARRINSKQRRRRFLSRQKQNLIICVEQQVPHCDFSIRQTPLRYYQYRTSRRRLRNSFAASPRLNHRISLPAPLTEVLALPCGRFHPNLAFPVQ